MKNALELVSNTFESEVQDTRSHSTTFQFGMRPSDYKMKAKYLGLSSEQKKLTVLAKKCVFLKKYA